MGPSLAKSVTREHRELQSFVEVLSQDMGREESEMLGDDVLRDNLAGE